MRLDECLSAGKKMISQISLFFKSALLPVGLIIGGLFGLWVKKVSDQKQRNTLNEIDNIAEKTSLDVHAEPIDDLVASSNKSHGADDMVKTAGDDPKKG